ncbi:MAG: SLC13 family permease [Thermomicrobiales bacterium]
MTDQAITITILAVAIVVFVLNVVPVGMVAMAVAISLWATGVVTLDQALAGFGTPTVVLIAALFVVAEGLDAAGLTTWVSQQVVRFSGDNRRRLMVMVMLAVAILSALITPNGSVAALYPMVVVLAIRMKIAPSKQLMPLAFGAHAGALLVLTGSPVSLLAAEYAADAGAQRFSFFSVALVGVPLLIGTIGIVLLLGDRLLPTRKPELALRDLSMLPATLEQQYIAGEEELARLRVLANSPLVGDHLRRMDTHRHPEVHFISVQDERGKPTPDDAVRAGSMIVVRGHDTDIDQFCADYGAERQPTLPGGDLSVGVVSKHFGVAEVLIAPRSNLIGQRAYPGMMTESGELVVLAVQRLGVDIGVTPTTLKAGDSLLIQGPWDALDRNTQDPNVVLVDTPDAIRRQTVPLGPKAPAAIGIMAAMIILLTTGWIPAVIVCLLAAGAMVLLRVTTIDQAHLSISWTTLILVAGMVPLSTAITQTGMAQRIAEHLVDVVGTDNPHMLLIGLFIVTAVLGQMVSNTATALIVFPIAVSVAPQMGVSVLPILMCVNVAAAAALLTPVATPANMMVMTPAGYRFGDYWKLGGVLMVLYFIVAVFLVPAIWPL